MIKFLISLFKPFRWFIEKMGADYNQFIRILELKLTMDNRRMKVLGNNARNETENALLKQSLSQIMFGVFFGMFLIIVKNPFTFYYFAHSFLMVMMAMMIISEFTSILFDTSENVIIQPLPIKGNTISLARNAHILIYLSMMAFNLSVISIIVAIVKFGVVSALLFSITVLFNVLFTLFLANLLYLIIMRLASGEKLKNILMYFQIFIAIAFMLFYQFGINVVDKSNIVNMVLPVYWYTYLIPSAFFAGLVESFTLNIFDIQHLIFIAEALLIPITAIFLTGKYLTPIFNRKLMDLEQGDKVSKIKIETARKSMWYKLMLSIFVHRKEEVAPFKLLWIMTGRERMFLQSFLPSIGYILIMIAVPFFRNSMDMDELVNGKRYLLILYSFMIVGSTLSTSLLYGNNRQAAWLFKTLPLSYPTAYFKAFIKAAFARFFVPFYLVLTLIISIVWGYKVIPDAFIAAMAIYFVSLLFYFFQYPVFPFTQDKIATQGGAAFVKIMGLMIIAVVLGFTHYFILKWFNYGSLILIPIYLGAIYYINRVYVYKKINWEEVDQVNTYS